MLILKGPYHVRFSQKSLQKAVRRFSSACCCLPAGCSAASAAGPGLGQRQRRQERLNHAPPLASMPSTSLQDTPQAVNVIDLGDHETAAVTTWAMRCATCRASPSPSARAAPWRATSSRSAASTPGRCLSHDGLRDFGACMPATASTMRKCRLLKAVRRDVRPRHHRRRHQHHLQDAIPARQIFPGAGRRQWRPCPRHGRPQPCPVRHRRFARQSDVHRHRGGGPRFHPQHPLGHRADHHPGPGHRHPMVAGLYAPAYRRPSRLRPDGGAAPRPADRRAGQRIWRAAQHNTQFQRHRPQ